MASLEERHVLVIGKIRTELDVGQMTAVGGLTQSSLGRTTPVDQELDRSVPQEIGHLKHVLEALRKADVAGVRHDEVSIPLGGGSLRRMSGGVLEDGDGLCVKGRICLQESVRLSV